MKNIVLSISTLPDLFFYFYFISLFFFKKKKTFKTIILINTFFLIVSSLPVTGYLLELPLYPKKNIYEENLNEKYSLILVPTAGFQRNMDNLPIPYPSTSSIKRLNDAYNFSKKLQVPIFISGGKTINYIDSEAEILTKNYFKDLKNIEIILETKSINSFDTGFYLNKYLNENNLEKNIILFTDIYHFKRMIGILEKKDIKVFFPEVLIKKKKINYYYFLPEYKNYKKMNEIRYSYFGLINYLFLKKMSISALFY